MSTEGQLTIALPPEMVGQVWSELTLPDLMVYGASSSANYAIVQNAINRLLHNLIDRFVPQGGLELFMAMLRAERAVISGSMALFFLFSCSYTGANSSGMDWSPADMDIFEPNIGSRMSEVVRYLISTEGFVELGCRVNETDDVYYPQAKKVTRLQKGKLGIDVITTYSSSAIAAIFGFHSTPVMNWISGDGFFSAYPQLTCAKRGLVNPMTFTLTNFVPPLPPSSVRLCLDKYRKRGFDIRRNPSCWPNENHICSSAVHCPHTTRSVTDHGTLYIRFKRPGEEVGVQSVDESDDTAPYKSPYVLFWSLGGPSCDGRHRICNPFVMLREEADNFAVTGW